MKTLLRISLAAVVLASGCKKDKKTDPAPVPKTSEVASGQAPKTGGTPDCDGMAAAQIDNMKTALAKNADMLAAVEPTFPRAKEMFATLCKTGWSAEAIACFMAAGDACDEKLTADQRKALQDASDELGKLIKEPGQLDADAAIAGQKDFRDRTCKCTDVDCANKIDEGWESFESKTEHARKDPKVAAELDKIDDERLRCVEKISKAP